MLYPSDMQQQGKQTRLKQQLFFVSAALQDILRLHLQAGGTDASVTVHLRSVRTAVVRACKSNFVSIQIPLKSVVFSCL